MINLKTICSQLLKNVCERLKKIFVINDFKKMFTNDEFGKNIRDFNKMIANDEFGKNICDFNKKFTNIF